MKKIALILSMAFLVAIAFTSCRSTKQCPAYGEIKSHQTERM